MKAVILVGVWGAGKTTLFRALQGAIQRHGCETVMSFPQASILRVHTRGKVTEDIDTGGMLDWCRGAAEFATDTDRRFLQSPMSSHRLSDAIEPRLLVEGFVFDAPVYSLPIAREETLDIERELACHGAHVVHLYVAPDQIRVRCLERTRIARGEAWSRFLTTFGGDDDERVRAILRAQDRLTSWLSSSPLPVVTADNPRDALTAAEALLVRGQQSQPVFAHPRNGTIPHL